VFNRIAPVFVQQGVGKIMWTFDFIERTAGLDWICVKTLDNALRTCRAERDPRGGARPAGRGAHALKPESGQYVSC